VKSGKHRLRVRRPGNLPAFLLFLAMLALIVGGVAFWRLTRPPQSPFSQIARTPSASPDSEHNPLPSLNALESVDSEFTDLVEHVIPSVVSINTVTAPDRDALIRQFFGISRGPLRPLNQIGSGMIVSKEGHIVTSWHVVKGATQITVQLSDGRSLPAQLAGADPRTDIAVLKIQAEGLSPIAFGDSDKVRVGQTVFAVGNPFGLQETVTQGIISAKGRRDTSEAGNEFFQTSTSINPGNSGSPLIDIRGQVIGINKSIFSKSGGSEGIAFAIPSNVARKIYEDIVQRGRVIHPWLGVVMRPLNAALARQLELPSTAGALVAATVAGSPADQGGLSAGDVIVSFNGGPINDVKDLQIRVMQTPIGSPVTLGFLRRGQLMEVRLIMLEEPEG
jgi:Do/DeqQ family serine protease